MRHGWLVWMAMAALLLAGCGSGPKVRLFPPELSLKELRHESDGDAVAVLRLRSFSTVAVRIDRISGHLEFGRNGERIPLALEPRLQVAATSVELLDVVFTPDPALRQRLERAVASREALDYRIEAEVSGSEPRIRFEIEYRSSLAPAPGLPGVFR